MSTSSRRSFIRAGALGATTVALGTSAAAPALGDAPWPVTPACSGHETPAAMEGPLFKPNSPETTKFVTPGTSTGVLLDFTGFVYATDCRPIAGALLEFWQCDQNGDYDTVGFSLRGHQFTAADGSYRLSTIVPRDYYGRWGRRAPHIHTQVQAPGGPVLVTQLYFPDNTQAYGRNFAELNAGDALINRACTIALNPPRDGRYTGRFDFVIKTRGDS
ncbi:dioxygenase [Allokutzneria sp. A3M-2-11 16]|uniref:dioxygenase family protein n=1 Tax=Allokutzneria sp. A3M-2-11 16 TaxID=2962043 RepID=UPI0020B6E56D|nr:dioxygenase [Allokutzneria sp. A3M-2-11 16]MCP3797813.1 dioxygenase [Allokutzneria sp. A3M-2-11 16]